MTMNIIALLVVHCFAHVGLNPDVLVDNLCIVDQSLYDTGRLNFCGGRAIYGKSLNFQAADLMETTGYELIDVVTMDFLTGTGETPDWICMRFYEGGSRLCEPAEDAARSILVAPDGFSWEPFDDGVFGLQGRRARAVLFPPCLLKEGCWYVTMQPASVEDSAISVAIRYAPQHDCITIGDVADRDGSQDDPCCESEYSGNYWTDWNRSGTYEPDTLSMRVEGVPAGDCEIGGALSAKCKPGKGKVVAKVKGASGAGVLTCWLDATPGPRRDMTIGADGKGKSVFRNVAPGEHTVTVCDQTVVAACGP